MTLSESDTRAKLIDPALKAAGWGEERIRREVQVTQGRLYLVGSETHRRQPVWADYVLSDSAVPIAVVEAKDEGHHVGGGLQQAKAYAEMLDVPFAYSSNGHGFVEFNYLTNVETTLAIDAFPHPQTLVQRLAESRGFPTPGDPRLHPFNTSGGLFPRYYQEVAVRRTLDAMAADRRRLLLALATGTGKTYIAAQLVWKLYQTKRIRRVLFLVDRIFLRDQAFNDFAFFAGAAGDPRYAIDGDLEQHADLYFGMYQSLYSDASGDQLFRRVPRDFFDLVIVDECHRSGFGTWREILDYFESAVHLGLTATPKRRDNIDTYAYFGEPVYTYSLGQGIDDGFLATYKVHRVNTNLTDAGGVDVEDAVVAGAELYVPDGTDTIKDFYSVAEFERKIRLPDWTAKITAHLAATLEASDPLEKTIVFCVNMDHALEVRQHLQNAFAHLGFADYAVRIVSEEAYGTALLEDFRDPTRKTPAIATTVDLLSTGVDIPSVRNIVFMKPIGSVVVFKQTVGRGTRLDPVTGKTWFRIIDYTNATRLFDDWDRPGEEPGELPERPWEAVIRLQAVDAETTELIPDAWGIAVAAPNEQVQMTRDDDLLVARDLPEKTVRVHVGAPGYRGRQVTVQASPIDEAEVAVVDLSLVVEAVERIALTGLVVEISSEIVLTVDATGQQMTVAQYLDYARDQMRTSFKDDADVTVIWLDQARRKAALAQLEHVGVHLGLIGDLKGIHDADAHDVITNVAFGRPLLRRDERAEAFANHNAAWIAGMPRVRREIVEELVSAYRDGGVDQLDRRVLRLARFEKFGGVVGTIRALGGSANLDLLLADVTARLYPVEDLAA